MVADPDCNAMALLKSRARVSAPKLRIQALAGLASGSNENICACGYRRRMHSANWPRLAPISTTVLSCNPARIRSCSVDATTRARNSALRYSGIHSTRRSFVRMFTGWFPGRGHSPPRLVYANFLNRSRSARTSKFQKGGARRQRVRHATGVVGGSRSTRVFLAFDASSISLKASDSSVTDRFPGFCEEKTAVSEERQLVDVQWVTRTRTT